MLVFRGTEVYPGDGPDVDALLKSADVAMYSAKEQGRNTYRFYSHELNARALERLDMERDLHRALERREFHLNYQPLVEAPGGKVVGVEALLRWRHPQRGLVPPLEFVPFAEKTTSPVGRSVAGGTPATVAVNVTFVPAPDGFSDETSEQEVASAVITPLVLLAKVTL